MTKQQPVYNATQSIYDEVLGGRTWWSRLYLNTLWGGVDTWGMARRVFNNIPAKFEGSLLEVPVGTGMFSFREYANRPNASITCLDYSDGMLRQMERRLETYGIQNVRCVQGDVGALPFEDESFDAVVSLNGFHAFPNKNAAFHETYRVLKKGGTFTGSFYIQGENWRTDLVAQVAKYRGFFEPPFETKSSLEQKLRALYRKVEVDTDEALVYFHCTK